jgi:hypothetical protein
MKKELDRSVEKFKNSQTSLEAYRAISDFVEIITSVPDFIAQVEKEGGKIQFAQIELNADKGWNYGLRGKELKQHNERRAKKHNALFQLDPMFPLRNLHNVYLAIQDENIVNNSDWLFYRFSPDDPLPEADKKEYQGFIDKLYKKIFPFLEEKVVEDAISPKDIVAMEPDFNTDKSILYLGDKEIEISSKNEKTNGHYILKYIFNSDEGLNQEYPFAEIANDEFDDDYVEQKSWRKYHRACQYVNEKIRKVTGIDDFLIFSSGRKGSVKINEKYLK